jgi:hypothetical protein
MATKEKEEIVADQVDQDDQKTSSSASIVKEDAETKRRLERSEKALTRAKEDHAEDKHLIGFLSSTVEDLKKQLATQPTVQDKKSTSSWWNGFCDEVGLPDCFKD